MDNNVTDKKTREPGKVSDEIVYCTDGKYRWSYELNLFKNPAIFFLVWKIFFFIIIGILVVSNLADLINGYFGADTLLGSLKIFGFILLGMTVLVLLGYLLYAAMMGGKYCVLFEMDEEGVSHTQMMKQVKKAELISLLTVLAGIASKNPTIAGVGLNSSARTSMYSEFSKVKTVKSYKKLGLIKVNMTFEKNQVYTAPEDFDFVNNFILEHCTNLKNKPKK